jgi:flagellar biosynthesis/type III secretory pathway protein FliH
MWEVILKALVKELETNPDRILDLVEEIIELLKSHPEAITPLVC